MGQSRFVVARSLIFRLVFDLIVLVQLCSIVINPVSLGML